MTQRKRVLHLITTFPQSSGAAENTKLTLNLLDRGRFEPFLGTRPGQSMESEVAPDVTRVQLHWLRRTINPMVDMAAVWEIYRVIRRYRFEVVHTHNAKDGILGRWAAFFAGVPAIVHTVHNISFEASEVGFVRWMFTVLERWAARITDRILVVSNENSKKCLRRSIGDPEQYSTVYSGLDLSRYQGNGRTPQQLRTDLRLPPRPGPWAAWVGRFNPQKDPVTFLHAARIMTEVIPGLQFVLCGDDPLGLPPQRDPRALVTELGLRDVVHFLGFRRDITTVLRAVDVVIHSSRYEGMGRVVCEALACERPVVGTAVDGVMEVIISGERGGLLVPPRNPRALADAVVTLLRNPQLGMRLAQTGHRWVEDHLSADRMVRTLEHIYDELTVRR